MYSLDSWSSDDEHIDDSSEIIEREGHLVSQMLDESLEPKGLYEILEADRELTDGEKEIIFSSGCALWSCLMAIPGYKDTKCLSIWLLFLHLQILPRYFTDRKLMERHSDGCRLLLDLLEQHQIKHNSLIQIQMCLGLHSHKTDSCTSSINQIDQLPTPP